MSKMELLAPAGDFESLKMAIYYGADAVYLGIKEFNARNNIEGFNINTLAQAVDFAHLYGVKVYLAINILFKDNELQSALDIVCEANNLGVDAFIIQDLGLARLIREYYPSVELHASTQMAVHNLEGVRILEKLGFERVVLSRETPINEIKRISANSNIEIEFFGQGALCVAFSGNCYMCSHLVDKSGNRGLCQQFCRLPYRFESRNTKKSGFLLSAKDISTLDKLKDLESAGVTSLKIEGRARRPFYVSQSCKVYRKALDDKHITDREIIDLNIAFNRQFTPAYLNGNENIISKIQGNNGVEIGTVKKVEYGKKFNEIFIDTDYDLVAPCGLKFIYNNEEIASIGAVDIKKINKLYRVTTTSKVKVGSSVNIIQDENKEKEALSFKRRLKIGVELIANPNKPLVMRAQYQGVQVEAEGVVCEQSKTIAISEGQILKQLSRSDVFEVEEYNIETNNCYLLNSAINSTRNEVYKKLQDKLLEKYKKIYLDKVTLNIDNISNKVAEAGRNSFDLLPAVKDRSPLDKEYDFEIIYDLSNLKRCNNIIYDFSIWNECEILEFDKYCNEHGCNGYIDIPNFAVEDDIKQIENVLRKTNLGVVANNIYALGFNCNIVGGQFLNVYNSYTIKALQELHPLDAAFVEELKRCDVNKLRTNIPILRREKAYMTLLHCPFKQNVGGNCADCKFDDARYIMSNGKRFKLYRKKIKSCVFILKD